MPSRMIRYIIENIYEFDPSEMTITNIQTNEIVKIHSTSAQCLLLLLEKHKNIVTQKQLLQFTWGEKSLVVTHNALYQCILNLRKNFTQVGCTKKIITTIPRKGLTIDETVTVEKIENQSNSASERNTQSPEVNKYLPFPIQINRKFSFQALSIMLGVVIIVSALIFASSHNDIDFQKDYIEKKVEQSSCKFFVNNDEGYQEIDNNLITPFIKNCDGGKFLFFTAYIGMNSKSVLICDNIPGKYKKTQCRSLYLP
ncbi:winged helix-turn-helix domain-containing protein [Buttiauxella gaviniae]|uniref:winged helix-turn-helix domain-containing protein n=1 Tax=Buttiauxella gaviniae TaxID=82990 RepID=UPI003976590F